MGVVNALSAEDGTGSMVRLERCTFTNNTGAHLLQVLHPQGCPILQPSGLLSFTTDYGSMQQ